MILSANTSYSQRRSWHALGVPACAERSIILSAGGVESIILSADGVESIILSACGAESMMLSARAESVILSACHFENVILSALVHAESMIPSGHTRACPLRV